MYAHDLPGCFAFDDCDIVLSIVVNSPVPEVLDLRSVINCLVNHTTRDVPVRPGLVQIVSTVGSTVWRTRKLAVVDEDGCGDGIDIEVVVVLDRQVPHPAVMVGWSQASDIDRRLGVRSPEMLARFEVICRNPLVQVSGPDEVVARGVDDCYSPSSLDVDVVEICVMVDPDMGDPLGLGFAGFGVGGEDFVAGFEGRDRDCLAGGEENFGVGGEGLAAGAGRGSCDGGTYGDARGYLRAGYDDDYAGRRGAQHAYAAAEDADHSGRS